MANHKENKSGFENQWKDAFENAEITPSANLWKNIDNQLTMQESGKYRKGFLFYRAVAAACIVCLLGLGYYVLQDNMEKGNRELATQAEQEIPAVLEPKPPTELALGEDSAPADMDEKAREGIGSPQTSTLDNALAQEQSDTPDSTHPGSADDKAKSAHQKTLAEHDRSYANARLILPQEQQDNTLLEDGNTALRIATLTESQKGNFALAYVSPSGPALIEEQEINWVKEVSTLYRVPQVVIDRKTGEQQPVFFAGLNLATNYFDPNFSAGGNRNFSALDAPNEFIEAGNLNQDYYAMSSRNTPANSGLENRPQLSLSYGADVGFMLTKHLSLESGLDYGRMNSRTQTSWVVEDFSQGQQIPLLASNAQRSELFNNRTQFTPQEQELTNSFAFLSVPLKLGYNLGFNRINFNLSSGVAANFFLNNRLSDDSGQLRTVNINASDDSPYRPVYYSGVVSGGVNYLIASNYALSVSPNYNFSLSALTADGNSFSSQPNAFGVDFGIRYNFR